MKFNLLIIHEIAYKASMVTSRKKFAEFEKWIAELLERTRDVAIEHYARIHLFQLKEQFG
jgi:hypothetical protein